MQHQRTRPTFRTLVLGLALAAATASGIGAAAPTAQESEPDWDALRQRWEQKTDDEKALMMQRFERLMELSDEDRSLFLERGRRLGRERRRWEEEHADGDFRQELRRRARQHAPRYRQHLPPPLLEELESSRAERRAAHLERHLQRMRRHESQDVVERLGRRLRMQEEELDGMRRLPEQKRMRRMLELRRRVMESENPRGEWRGLSDEEFHERMRERRGRRNGPERRRRERSNDV